jgi:pimeloyl-ACP methyl ester carboxylesterase
MRVTGADGVGIEVWVNGPAEGRPVLLLHGWPDSHTLWRHQVKALNDAGYRTIAPDLRGFGVSDKPDAVEDYALQNVVVDLANIVDAVAVDSKVAVVGHDWGAAAAWGFAAFLPDRTDRLAVLSVGHPKAFFGAGWEQRARSWYMLLFNFPGVAEQWWEKYGAVMLASHPDRDACLAALAKPGALTASFNWYRANAHPRGLIDGPRDLPPVSMPVLGIWSTQDIALLEEQMKNSAQFVDGPFRYERIEGVGHWMQVEAADEVNRLLLDFLS